MRALTTLAAVETEDLLAGVERELLARAFDGPEAQARITHLHRLPERRGVLRPVPDDLPAPLPGRLAVLGIDKLYTHQAEALALVRAGRHLVVATGTASGKSLCYQLPVCERLLVDEKATALYLAPTKALARDQVRALRGFRLPQLRAAAYDGDTPRAEREAIRRTTNVLLTNPDMLHAGLLPHHRRWGDFFHRLAVVIVDECHVARGVFGTHVAALLRRLRRVVEHYSGAPVFVLASATIGNPAEHAEHLTGLPVTAVLRDGSPRSSTQLALWEPPLVEKAAGTRRSTLAEAADILAGLVARGPATLAFVRSRKAAELVAAAARRRLGPDMPVLAYRAGLLGEERRLVERGLIDGSIRGVATTDALELGVDVGALDAVVIVGWPGTTASFWQQAGRAGRRGQQASVVFVADDNPLDHFLLRHPTQLYERPLEHAVTDLSNPYVLLPHLRCAAWELPLSEGEDFFAPVAIAPLLDDEVAAGNLRKRGDRWYWAGKGTPQVNLRSAGGEPYAIVEAETGTLVGEADESRAMRTVHPGAVYLHQGATYEVERLDLARRVALVRASAADTYTRPRSETELTVRSVEEEQRWGRCLLARGRVEVTSHVLAYERRRVFTDELLERVELDLPSVRMVTAACWLALPEGMLAAAGLGRAQIPGAAHAAEHAAIGLLSLFAMSDRWDVGGVSTAWHPDTAQPSIFVYDAYPGGAGITERGFASADRWLRVTCDTIAGCGCADGCPSCVQSPKCGNGNEPLDKLGAVALLNAAAEERERAQR